MAIGLISTHHNLLQQLPFDGQSHNPALFSETVRIIVNVWCDSFSHMVECVKEERLKFFPVKSCHVHVGRENNYLKYQ